MLLGESNDRSGPILTLDRAIYVWFLRSEADDDILASFFRILSPDEIARANHFCFDYLRRRFILVRGALRFLLGRYAGLPPAGIQFNYSPRGKPSIATHSRIRFNVSHSRGIAVLGFASDCDMGVDIEEIRPINEVQELAERFFTKEESAELRLLPPAERERAFFLCWTRKEAYLKAAGDGLSLALDSFRVDLRMREPVDLMQIANASSGRPWALRDLSMFPEYAASLVYADASRQVFVRRLQPVELLGADARECY